MSIFTALVVVLQLIGSAIHIGPVSISLVLIPIVVGAAVYGPAAGSALGAVFGVVVVIGTVSGADPGANFLWNMRPFWTVFFIMLKGILCGWLAGLTYVAAVKKQSFLGFPYGDIQPEGLRKKLIDRRALLAVMLAAIVCPVVNTGVFTLGMVTVFREALVIWAAGADLVYYVFIGLIGVNFIAELVINIVLSPVVVRIIRASGKKEAA